MNSAGHIITSPSTVLPVSISETRRHLRNEGMTYDNEHIELLIWAATRAIETQYSLSLIQQTVLQNQSGFQNEATLLRICPLLELTSIKYIDTSGAEKLADIADFATGTFNGQAFIVPKIGKEWPSTAKTPNSVSIEYKAGFGQTADSVPSQIKMAILLIVGDLYTNREDRVDNLPTASTSLLRPFYRFSV